MRDNTAKLLSLIHTAPYRLTSTSPPRRHDAPDELATPPATFEASLDEAKAAAQRLIATG